MTPQQTQHARIMVEGGCTLEDVAITFNTGLHDVARAVAPSLKANAEARARARCLLRKRLTFSPSIAANDTIRMAVAR